jgi:probable phosphoglycerate mutase
LTEQTPPLFGKPAAPKRSFAVIANIDGGARGNPGPAAYGVVIRNANGEIIAEFGKHLGIQTNNVAEYSGLLAALEWAVKEKHGSLKVLSDSELLVRQMQGKYKVNNAALKQLFDRAQASVRQLQLFAIEHVRRESNRDADRIVNEVLDGRK